MALKNDKESVIKHRMSMLFKWLRDIKEKHPDFNVSKWIPPSIRYKHLSLVDLWKMELEDLRAIVFEAQSGPKIWEEDPS
jgi:hypothetical protein